MIKHLSYFFLAINLSLTGCASIDHARPEKPVNALERLQAGNHRFAQHRMHHPDQSAARIVETATGQKPFVAIVTCSDSRVPPEIIFDEGIGDLFVIRNAGNIADEEDVLASIEYAVAHLHVNTVVVMGHEHCGAIEAMTHETYEGEPEHIAAILQRLKDEPEEQLALHSGDKGEPLVHKCVAANVQHGVAVLSRQLGHAKSHGTDAGVLIVGAVYDIQTGIVHFQEVNTPLH